MKTLIPEQLLEFRKQIDAIDNQIVELLGKRAEIVVEVGKFKKESKEKFFIHSNREADMVKNLVSKASPLIPKSTIVNIWRKIIASSNIIEQNLKIAIHNPNKIADYFYQVREYYGDFISIQNFDSINNIVLEMEKGQIHIAIFALPLEMGKDNLFEHWWISLANNNQGLKVFTKIPFIEYAEDEFMEAKGLVAMAIKKPEKSDEDKTLLCVEVKSDVTSEQLLEALRSVWINSKIFKSAKLKGVENITFYLVEVEGFFENDAEQIAEFTKSAVKPYVKILGHYPASIKISREK